jgi:hypothetical protein
VWLENSTFFFFIERTKAQHTRVLLEVCNRKRVDSLPQAQFCPGMWRLPLIVALTVSSAVAQDQPTAYEALRVVGTQFNRAAMRRVLSVTGVDGDPQPTTWKVMIADRNAPGGVREFEVADGRIVSNRTPTRDVVGTTEGATIDTSKLNLDSSGAFTVASYTADKAHTNFSYASYTLRTNDRGIPVWIITLQNEARRPLGTIHIGANKGNVVRVEGMYRGADMAQVQEDQAGPAAGDDNDRGNDSSEEDGDGDENVVKAEIKRMFHRTKRDAQRMFGRVRRSFDQFFNRE